jgi:hypothetical protein
VYVSVWIPSASGHWVCPWSEGRNISRHKGGAPFTWVCPWSGEGLPPQTKGVPLHELGTEQLCVVELPCCVFVCVLCACSCSCVHLCARRVYVGVWHLSLSCVSGHHLRIVTIACILRSC